LLSSRFMSESVSADTPATVPAAAASTTQVDRDSLLRRLTPRASARVQLVLAATVWLVGASILAVRGLTYLLQSHWAAWLLALALVMGIAKGHLVLDGVARKAVARIRERDRDGCLFGFFSWKSWLFIGLMMGGGIALRNSGAPSEVLAVIYAAVATGLLYGDRIYWRAVFSVEAS